MTIERIAADPGRIAAEVASLLRPRAIAKGIDLDVRLDSPIPEQIVSDPTRLRQVMMNLVGNAIKFTEVGSVTIALSCDTEAELLAVAVEDTGIGMTEEQRAEIARFQAFRQADGSTTRRFGGSGLGLRISNTLTTMLGGEIDIVSEVGRGSTGRRRWTRALPRITRASGSMLCAWICRCPSSMGTRRRGCCGRWGATTW